MKIAYLSTFYPLRGGIAQFNASLYYALKKEHDVKAFTFSRQYPECLFPGKTQYVTKKDENAIKIESVEVLDTINPYTYIETIKHINNYKPDILLMKYWMPFFAIPFGIIAKFIDSNIKVVTILDNVKPHEKRFIDNVLTKFFLKQNDGFVTMSYSVSNDLNTIYPKNTHIQLTHPNYEHFGSIINQKVARFKLNISPHKKTILFFGFIRPYKGLDMLIEAFLKLDDTYQLVIAGECYGDFASYQKLIDQSGRYKDIYVHNYYINDKDVATFFSASDVCVLPYRTGTQSGIASVAFNYYLPIIVTDVGGLGEVVYDGINGYILKKNSSLELKNIIQKYFNNNVKFNFRKNIKRILIDDSWDSFAKSVIQFFCRI
ncbi:glycosyltransferase (plasmid) [Flammeovirga sp. MY04]|uniref:glycosyltransferase n=1 Tax=Flammeovirga sp. MY04 TaxID=1191459 RepID=UPI0008061A0A|nr:glycosyltransferase [Flammeovirga sp. MY04]ANQ52869.1 glycosyltransferase [Flammeovirga sp. MY04]